MDVNKQTNTGSLDGATPQNFRFKIDENRVNSLISCLRKQIQKSDKRYETCLVILRGGMQIAKRLKLGNTYIAIRAKHYDDNVKKKLKIQSIPKGLEEPILIIDDVVDTGDTVIKIQEILNKREIKDIDVATLVLKNHSKYYPRYWALKTEGWCDFPWEK